MLGGPGSGLGSGSELFLSESVGQWSGHYIFACRSRSSNVKFKAEEYEDDKLSR